MRFFDLRVMKLFLRYILPLLVIVLLAVYFRTYALHGGPRAFRSSEGMAREAVDRGLAAQIRTMLEKSYPELSVEERKRLAGLQVERLKSEDRGNYEATIKKTASSLERGRGGAGYQYLLEADAYYFLLQTKKLLETGKISDVRRNGRYLETFMRGTHGNWTVILLHPYVGFYWYKFVQLFSPQASLMKTLGFLSILLTLLIVPLYLLFGKVLRIPFGASVMGLVTILFSPIFIQRSALGWYDTDPYSYLFPLSILAFVFQGLKGPKWFWVGVLGSSLMTALYALFWPGWAFIAVLIPFSLFGSVAILWFFQGSQTTELMRNALRFLSFYVLAALVFLACFLTREGLWDSLSLGWEALQKFSLSEFDVWPNIFLTVGEAGGISVLKLIFLTGNYVTFTIAVLGLLWEGLHVFRRQNLWERFRFLFFIIFGAPIFIMALRTQRFSILFVLPLAIFLGFAVARFMDWGENVFLRIFPLKIKRPGLARAFSLFLIVIFFAPLLLLTAHIVALGIKPIMDDVWYASMTELEAKTPKDAIIDSWWSPGYFISGIARRRVVADGGTQHFRTSFWTAKALMTQDEREAAGILRMINTDMEDGPDLLEQWGMKTSEVVELILKIVRMNRSDALLALPSFLSSTQKELLLDKTHGRGILAPSYFLVYNDLVEQNLAVSVMASWDFRKAERIREDKKKPTKGLRGLLRKSPSSRYFQELLQVTGKWLRYTAVSPLVGRKGDILFFANGLRVNWATKEAIVLSPSQGPQGIPLSLFFLSEGKLVEKEFLKPGIDVSALVTEDQGVFYSVVADEALIRSMLFRLYYFKGVGLSFFKPFLSQGSLQGGTVVRVFELDRERFKDSEPANQ